ncbi:MAG: type IV pilus assembly protein PilW [Halioglobus sp.]|jgi:type IV pilus assembly protein PilW
MSIDRTRGVARGFSLIEFMVAMLLGTILISGAVSVYLASKRSYVEVEQVGGLSENGRFALQIMKDSLLHAGFYGPMRPGDFSKDVNLGAVTNDCTGNAAAYGLTDYFFSARTTGDPGKALSDCITDAVTNTNVLVVKYLVPSPIYDADPDDPNAPTDGVLSFPGPLLATETYAIVNSEYGLLLDGADSASAPDVSEGETYGRGVAWPYRFEIYYVRRVSVGDGFMPTLARKTLRWNGSAMDILTEDLVEGVELFYLRFGITNAGSGEVEGYTSLADLNGDGDLSLLGTAKTWDQVDSIEAFVLVRSATEDPLYTDSKTYNLGDVSITPSSQVNYSVNVRRLMMRSNISLRNPKLVIRGGA